MFILFLVRKQGIRNHERINENTRGKVERIIRTSWENRQRSWNEQNYIRGFRVNYFLIYLLKVEFIKNWVYFTKDVTTNTEAEGDSDPDSQKKIEEVILRENNYFFVNNNIVNSQPNKYELIIINYN